MTDYIPQDCACQKHTISTCVLVSIVTRAYRNAFLCFAAGAILGALVYNLWGQIALAVLAVGAAVAADRADRFDRKTIRRTR